MALGSRTKYIIRKSGDFCRIASMDCMLSLFTFVTLIFFASQWDLKIATHSSVCDKFCGPQWLIASQMCLDSESRVSMLQESCSIRHFLARAICLWHPFCILTSHDPIVQECGRLCDFSHFMTLDSEGIHSLRYLVTESACLKNLVFNPYG